MEKKQYDEDQLKDPYRQDLWNDYMNSLDEEGQTEPEEDENGLSYRVEQDLDHYSNEKKRKRTAKGVIIGMLVGVTLLTAGAVGAFMRISDSAQDDYYVEPYTYDDDYDYDDVDAAYSSLGRGFRTPEFVFNDQYYRLPVSFADFDLKEYSIKKDAFSEEITEVGAEPVRVLLQNEWGDTDTVLLVVSPDGSTVPLSESVIIGISSSSYNLTISDWYSPGNSEYYFLEDLEDYGYDIGTYTYSDMEEYRIVNDAPSDSGYEYYNLSFQVRDSRISDITLLLSQEDLH